MGLCKQHRGVFTARHCCRRQKLRTAAGLACPIERRCAIDGLIREGTEAWQASVAAGDLKSGIVAMRARRIVDICKGRALRKEDLLHTLYGDVTWRDIACD